MILGVPEAAEPGEQPGSVLSRDMLPLPVVEGRLDDPAAAGGGTPEDKPVP
jgi:hypothetical protein